MAPTLRSRAPKSNVQSQLLEQYLKVGSVETDLPLDVIYIPEKNRGVIATRLIKKGDFVVEYHGELIGQREGKLRELEYAKDDSKGNFLFFFKHNGKNYCIDATEENGRMGRLINHSRFDGNLEPKVLTIGGIPKLLFIAKTDIMPGTELTFDYGDRKNIDHFPWLSK